MIDKGLFQVDSNNDFKHNLWMITSRFTWEGLQTGFGNVYSQIKNVTGHVDRVDYFGGATFCTNQNSSVIDEKGITMGCFINIDIDDEIDEPFYTFMTTQHHGVYMHEYGHMKQSMNYGLAYLPYVGIQSLVSASHHDGEHRYKWYEREASAYGRRYFGDEIWLKYASMSYPTYNFLNY